MKYSIIIPVYQSQNTIIDCIKGIIEEAKDTELIIVSDDSEESAFKKTSDTIRAYIDKNDALISMYIIKNKKDKGVSGARNTGLEIATGKYIWFVDSDDQVQRGWYDVWESATAHEPDLMIAGYEEWDEDSLRVIRKNACNVPCMDKQSFVRSDLQFLQKNWLINAIWNKLFKREFIETYHIRFPENGSMGEDLVFSLRTIEQATSVGLSDRLVYRYIHHLEQESACDVFHENALRMTLDAYEIEQRIYELANIKMPNSVEQSFVESVEAYIRDLVILNSGKMKQYRDSVDMVSKLVDTHSYGLARYIGYKYIRIKRFLSWLRHKRKL